jgi:hypothetical protein
MDKSAFFGQLPSSIYAAGFAVTSLPQKGYMTVHVLTDTVFSVLTYAHVQPTITGKISASGSLAGVTIPGGTILYGVATLTVTSGNGTIFYSVPQVMPPIG